MKIQKKTFAGLWFALGVVLTLGLVLLHLQVPLIKSNLVGISTALIVGTSTGMMCGRRWGLTILNLEKHKRWKAIGLGILIGILVLYAIVMAMLIFSYSETEFLKLLHEKAYWSIPISILKLPGLALFGTVMGCILEPLVILMSGLGGGALYLLRHKIPPLLNRFSK